MKPTVYLETSVVSYVAARPSRDIVVAAQQQLTHEWWNTRRSDFELVISDEASAGDPDAAARRLKFLSGLRVLRPTDADASLAQALVARLSLPRRAAIDALHIAIAAANNVQYLLTWNCSHIANAVHRPGIQSVCVESGLSPPLICTPQELM
ncbi:MAG: type II toxin-antitoxin system VapC family toxin [Phycisphaeraceae bacterium]|nr:MAG: type II toxin-antitoxin system VapC family toxin [Phycisphaeraceae bacterium]